jgi:WD40 repeat protein
LRGWSKKAAAQPERAGGRKAETAPMTACPSLDQLPRLLADELSAAEEDALDGHLQQCATCRRALEALSASTAVSHDAPSAFSVDLLEEWKANGDSISQLRRGPVTLPAESRPLPRVVGYEILGLLGHGGMGVVYRARQVGLNRIVALKMIIAGAFATNKSLARFRAEALAVARLQHPNIVQIFEIGDAEGLPYFSQEYVEGGTLAAQLDGTRTTPRRAAELCELLARAVQFAHDRGVVHRDLKPGNVLLTPDGAPKIADFGLAKRFEDSGEANTPATEAGLAAGTPRYMAPEQLSPSGPANVTPIGPACDVYALGAILYELLTGRPLYTGASPMGIFMRVLHDEPTPPHIYVPALPRDLETICLKCLAKVPSQRYASARDLAEDLRRFLVREAILARPPSFFYLSGKFIQRHKPLVGAAAAIALVMAAGIVATSVTALSEAHQRRVADENARLAENARQNALVLAYQARMAAAMVALGDHNVGESAEQLKAVPENQRGWEWRYASSRLDDSLGAVRDIGRALVPCAAGKRFASITDQGICLWDAANGRLIGKLSSDVPENIDAATARDGTLVLVSDHEKDSISVRGEDGRIRQQLALPGKALTHAWALDATATRLACSWVTVRGTKEFALFDLTSCERLARFAFDATNAEIRCIAFSPNGRRLATGGDDRLVRVWDADDGSCTQTLKGHTGFLNGVVFSPDGLRVLSCAADQTFRQWDVETGSLLDDRFGDIAEVSAAAYSPDGRWIATGGADGTVRYWPTAGGPAVAVMQGHAAPVWRLAFSPDGRRASSVSRDRSSGVWEGRVWDGPGHGDPRVLREHTSFVYPVAYSPDGRTIASGAWDKEIRLYDARTGETRIVLRGHEQYVADLAFSPDSRHLVSRSPDGTIRVWDVASGKPVAQVQHGGVGIADRTHGVTVTPDGTRAACASGDRLFLWELSTGRALGSVPLPTASARSVQYRHDGQRIAVVDNGPDVFVLDGATGKTQVRLNGHSGRVNAVAWSPRGTRLVSASTDRTVRLWNAATGECLHVLRGHTDEVFAAVFHPDGSRIASAGRDRVVRIWDPTNGAELARLPGHTSYVFSLAFSPDGATLVSGSGDYTVRLWDTFPVARRLLARTVSSR